MHSNFYCEQLDRVYAEMKRWYPALVNRKGIILQQDNAPAHRARSTQSKFVELEGVEILPHLPSSPDCAPSDYGLFRSMQHFLRGKCFNDYNNVEMACREFFSSKSQVWYFSQIRNLAERWKQVIDNGGLYFDE